MGKYGAALQAPDLIPIEWWKSVVPQDASGKVSGAQEPSAANGMVFTVSRGGCKVAIILTPGPYALKRKPIFLVQYGGFSSKTRNKNKRLAEEIIDKLVALGAERLPDAKEFFERSECRDKTSDTPPSH